MNHNKPCESEIAASGGKEVQFQILQTQHELPAAGELRSKVYVICSYSNKQDIIAVCVHVVIPRYMCKPNMLKKNIHIKKTFNNEDVLVGIQTTENKHQTAL